MMLKICGESISKPLESIILASKDISNVYDRICLKVLMSKLKQNRVTGDLSNILNDFLK